MEAKVDPCCDLSNTCPISWITSNSLKSWVALEENPEESLLLCWVEWRHLKYEIELLLIAFWIKLIFLQFHMLQN
jgi:hypothetical protein